MKISAPILPPSIVLFDLDGTITDSIDVVTTSLQKMVKDVLGREESKESFIRFVGPPLAETMKVLDPGADAARVEYLIAEYRKVYFTLHDSTPLFAGIEQVLSGLRQSGVRLAVATSKLETAAIDILTKRGIVDYFETVSGALPAPAVSHKEEVVANALSRLGVSHPVADPSPVLMVGDRIYDVEGAGKFGIPTALVTWGGTAGAGEESLAALVVKSTEELLPALGL